MNRREAVPKLVGDAGRQLTETCERILQPKLFLEIDNRCQVGEKANRALLRALFARKW